MTYPWAKLEELGLQNGIAILGNECPLAFPHHSFACTRLFLGSPYFGPLRTVQCAPGQLTGHEFHLRIVLPYLPCYPLNWPLHRANFRDHPWATAPGHDEQPKRHTGVSPWELKIPQFPENDHLNCVFSLGGFTSPLGVLNCLHSPKSSRMTRLVWPFSSCMAKFEGFTLKANQQSVFLKKDFTSLCTKPREWSSSSAPSISNESRRAVGAENRHCWNWSRSL